MFFVFEVIGSVQMREFTDQFVDPGRYVPVVRVQCSRRDQLATGFEKVDLRLELGHLFQKLAAV